MDGFRDSTTSFSNRSGALRMRSRRTDRWFSSLAISLSATISAESMSAACFKSNDLCSPGEIICHWSPSSDGFQLSGRALEVVLRITPNAGRLLQYISERGRTKVIDYRFDDCQ